MASIAETTLASTAFASSWSRFPGCKGLRP
jgi:hypothetical protein